MILRIIEAGICGPHRLEVAFNDGSRRAVDVRLLLEGPVFKPLLDPDYFAQGTLDLGCGTVVWPNGADLAPEALRELPDLSEAAVDPTTRRPELSRSSG